LKVVHEEYKALSDIPQEMEDIYLLKSKEAGYKSPINRALEEFYMKSLESELQKCIADFFPAIPTPLTFKEQVYKEAKIVLEARKNYLQNEEEKRLASKVDEKQILFTEKK